MKSKVVVKKCFSYDLAKLEECLTDSLSLLGGVSTFFKPNSSVLLKPNLLTDSPPEKGITTHPVFVQAMVRLLKKHGLKVAIADIPGEHRLESKLERVYQVTGMLDVAQDENVELLTESKFIEEDGVIFSSWVREFDYLVSLPKFKTHSLTTLTGAVKNLFGLTPRLYRINLHKINFEPDKFAKILLDVYKKCIPRLSLVDGILAMEGNGPASGGTLRNVGLVAVSSDAFALDSVLTYIMGLKPEEVCTNRQARLQGLGNTDLDKIEIIGDNLNAFLNGRFKLPPTNLASRIPKNAMTFLIERFAKIKPRVDKFNCNGCRICVENCPIMAISILNKRAKIDYQRCIDCFCCLEVCPKAAMKMKAGPLIYALKFKQYLNDLAKRANERRAEIWKRE